MNRKPRGKMEERAYTDCKRFEEYGQGDIAVVWNRSATWGYCPSIRGGADGGKAAYASGCGYDKLSAVLADYLRWLIPDIERSSGAGIQSLIERGYLAGWALKHTYDGEREDAFTITRLPRTEP